MEQFIEAKLLKADLIELDRQFEDEGIQNAMSTILLYKHAFVSIANVVDFELSIRSHYAKHRNLSSVYAGAAKEFEFAKYLRNKLVGHIHNELIEKAIEWRPEFKYTLHRTDEPEAMYIYNLWLLETAINTYVNPDGTHKLFASETDLMYPPDWKRFLIFLTKIVKSGIEYLEAVGEALGSDIEMPDLSDADLNDWIKAGKTDFQFLTKK